MKLWDVALLFKETHTWHRVSVSKPSGGQKAARAPLSECGTVRTGDTPRPLRHRGHVCGAQRPSQGVVTAETDWMAGARRCPHHSRVSVLAPSHFIGAFSRQAEGWGSPSSAAGKRRGRAGATLPALGAPRGGAGRVAPGPLAKSGSEQPNPAPWARGGRGGTAGRAPLLPGAGGRAKLSSPAAAARHRQPPRRAPPAWAPTRCRSAPTAGRPPPPPCCCGPCACSAGGEGTGAGGGRRIPARPGRGSGAAGRARRRRAARIGPRRSPPAPPLGAALSAPAGPGAAAPAGWRPPGAAGPAAAGNSAGATGGNCAAGAEGEPGGRGGGRRRLLAWPRAGAAAGTWDSGLASRGCVECRAPKGAVHVAQVCSGFAQDLLLRAAAEPQSGPRLLSRGAPGAPRCAAAAGLRHRPSLAFSLCRVAWVTDVLVTSVSVTHAVAFSLFQVCNLYKLKEGTHVFWDILRRMCRVFWWKKKQCLNYTFWKPVTLYTFSQVFFTWWSEMLGYLKPSDALQCLFCSSWINVCKGWRRRREEGEGSVFTGLFV